MRVRAVGAAAAIVALLVVSFATGRSLYTETSAGVANTITLGGAPGTVAVGNNFNVTLAVTSAGVPYGAIQWELAYGPNIDYVSSTYNCTNASGINFPNETETPPTETTASSVGLTGLAGLDILGQGANCASLNQTFAGTSATGTFVTVTLQCASAGTAPLFLVDDDAFASTADPAFGTTTITSAAAGATSIPTDLAPSGYATPGNGYGTQAGFDVICGQASVPTPTATATATNTPGNTPTPLPTNTPCVGAQCPTSTPTKLPVFTRTPTATATGAPGTPGAQTPVAGGNTPGPGGGSPGPGGQPGGTGSRPGGIILPDTGDGGGGGSDLWAWLVAGGAVLIGAAGAGALVVRRQRAR